MTREEMLKKVEAGIGYKFKDISNLNRALTHSSYRNQPNLVTEYRNINECLEFLGDSVLDFVISEYLYNLYPDWNEGKLSKLRSKVVCEQSLVIVARKL
ncbi:MAG: ribonuclease III, partial [Clostridiales bacterium]|nr:ribonuclease III [Clostridiales bacterium]